MNVGVKIKWNDTNCLIKCIFQLIFVSFIFLILVHTFPKCPFQINEVASSLQNPNLRPAVLDV